jgi:uncharacterized membrane protein YhaH (DUF805 family)
MIRFLFPRISFSGRLSRLGFWRELTVSAITTPIAVGIVTYLIHEAARAAEHGLVVDNVRAKAAVGFFLAAYALRNTLVFVSIIRRRLNDLGLEGTRVFKPVVPLLLFFGGSFIVTLVSQAPPGGEKQLAIGLLTFALVATLLWQVLRAANTGFQVMFGPSGALAGGRSAPNISEAISAPMPRDVHKATARLRAKFDFAIQDLKDSAQGKPAGFEAVDRLFAPVMGALNEWGKPAPAGAEISRTREREQARRAHWKSTKPRPAVREEKAKAPTRVEPVRGSGRSVVVARHEPRAGRSKWYSGLLSGPWG